MSALDELPSRQVGNVTELQCPCCHSWRVAFLLTETPAAKLDEVGGATWVCDNERSRWHREQTALGKTWNSAAKAWLPDLASARTRQRAIINKARDLAQDGGCKTAFGFFDTTPRSRQMIAEAGMAALAAKLAGQPFARQWTLADNTIVALCSDKMICVACDVAAHGNAIHQRAEALKKKIDFENDLSAIASIQWT